ncbi:MULTISPECIES: hypothetical protein [unclassified Crossiella]|uniref:hypothetical protein n=1 Tax=unclassified Crossiella TaxID=2620835 RepID=UPI001FFE749B|nr:MULTISPECIES: hypothetical protein [unclassified Crossiella]MCK2237724.1 hypothetical protein [Crossiella sp. S99.2]MCK2255010.1 hypothetical protein [Crossiella sp. S99.1]
MSTTIDRERPACVLGCRTASGTPWLAQHGYLTCDPCATELRSALGEIVDLYALLDDALIPGTTGPTGTRGAPGFGSRSPANDAVIVATDIRTRHEEEGDPHSVLAVMSSWADNIIEYTGAPERSGPATVAGEVRVIIKHLDFVTKQLWVVDLAEEIYALQRQLLATLGLQERSVPVGTCPARVPDPGSAHLVVCGQQLRVRLHSERITCRSCGAAWPRERWDDLRFQMGGPAVIEIASFTVWLRVPSGTLRRWRHEDQWHNYGNRSRALYARTDVLASWQRRGRSRVTAPAG